jgi:hypothetical protein
MTSIASELREMVVSATPRLLALSDARVSGKPYAEKWSLKEVLGHLIDSASNNHQRFVRMQLQSDIGTFSYKQDEWNSVQKYHQEHWGDLVELWAHYNKHLAHVIEHVDAGSLNNVCDTGYPNPAKLSFVMEDYVRHVRHHLDQILSGTDPRERMTWVRRDPKGE